MDEKRNFPFPQADDFDKVVAIVNIDDEAKLSDKNAIARLLGDITERQVQYYLSACQYLGLITADKKFSDLGDSIRAKGESQQFVDLARLIVSDEIFGTVYFSQLMLGCTYSREEIIEVMHDHKMSFDSEDIYKRRAHTVERWVAWIDEKISK